MGKTTAAIRPGPVLVVEDDPAMRQRLRRLLTEASGDAHAGIVEAGDVAGARSRLACGTFALALIDIGLPDGSGIELIARMRGRCSDTPCVVVSAWGDEETVFAALQAGAVGYLLKEREDIELVMALRCIARGGAPIDPFVARRILRRLPLAPASDAAPAGALDDALSERESEVLELVARGFSNREIADITGLSRFTIEGYIKSIYGKLAVKSRTAAVYEAKNLGLLR